MKPKKAYVLAILQDLHLQINPTWHSRRLAWKQLFENFYICLSKQVQITPQIKITGLPFLPLQIPLMLVGNQVSSGYLSYFFEYTKQCQKPLHELWTMWSQSRSLGK